MAPAALVTGVERIIQMESRKLDSSDFYQLLCVLTPEVEKIVRVAESRGYMPPFELLITDADDHVVFQCEVNRNATVRSFNPDLNAPLKGLAPLTISLTDQKGHVWSWKFEKPTRRCIQ
jgi:hypothetical protein